MAAATWVSFIKRSGLLNELGRVYIPSKGDFDLPNRRRPVSH
jgi:hypothetical protein